MTIRILQAWSGYYAGQIVSGLAGAEETRLIGLSYASADLDGAAEGLVPLYGKPNPLTGVIEIIDPETGLPLATGGSSAPVALTATRATAAGDNGAILENSTASTLTVTLTASTIASGLTLMNTGTGQIVVTLGAGVTLVDGASSVAAPFQGQMIHIIPTVTANKFLAKVG